MKILSVLFLALLLSCNCGFATRYVTQTYTTPNYYNYNPSIYNQYQSGDMNLSKLNVMEKTLYGRTYDDQNTNARLNRLEQSVFNRTYPTAPFAQRMDNLMMNYNNNYPNMYSKNTTRTGKLGNLINGLSNMFYGTPTGFTPMVNSYNTLNTYPNSSDYGRQYGYYGRDGWRVNNENVGGGVGIKILD